jgi:uncharacterized protein YndB with AHSA1/START domain
MKLELFLEETYPHPIEKVWKALTDPAALAVWLLMGNDFEPRVGRRFAFRATPRPDFRGHIDCEVLVLEPPTRMVWSWQSSDEGLPTQVEFRLTAVDGGTRLALSHTGDAPPETIARVSSGWRLRMQILGEYINLH